MTTEQANITEAVIQVAAKAAVQAMAMASTDKSQRAQKAGPKLGWPIMKQPTFNWSSTDKYAELMNFKMEVKNKFQNICTNQAERVPIIKNWLGRQSL